MMELGINRMSSLTKSLQKRIEELRLSIESQRAELAAYEKVLEVEVGREDVSVDRQRIARETDESNQEAQLELTGEQGGPRLPTGGRAASGNGEGQGPQAAAVPEFTGNKTDFVRAIVKARGSLGATPSEIADVFKARQIEKSKNFIYNALDVLVKQNKFKRDNGRYFAPFTDAQGKRAASAPRALKESEKPTRNDGQESERRKLRCLPLDGSRTIGKRLPLSGERLVARLEELGLPRNVR
jgi:hypothetical protein